MRNKFKRFVDELSQKQDRLIPIIGEDCFIGILKNEDDKSETTLALQEYIVESILGDELSIERKKEISSKGYYGMDLLYDEYCNHINQITSSKFRLEVKYVVSEGLNNNEIHLRNDVKEFLASGRFDVIITTNVFHILFKELSDIGISYNSKIFVPTAHKEENRSEEKLSLPSIYQIFGDCDGEFVLTEKDLLKFLHYLNSPSIENGRGANALAKYLQDKPSDGKGNCILMPIGCSNLPNWLFRFLWYPLSPNALLGGSDDYEGGAWHKQNTDEDFYKFLSNYNFKILLESSETNEVLPDPVLKVLSEKFNEKSSAVQKSAAEMDVEWEGNQWDIFISYASEDKEIACEIFDVLKKKGKKVWMDNRNIALGDKYWGAIKFGIEHSERCMFVITDTYLEKARSRSVLIGGERSECGVFKEIEIIEEHYKSNIGKYLIKGYAIPLILENTIVASKMFNSPNAEKKLDGMLLETLHEYPEYSALRTGSLFKNTQAEIFNTQNINSILNSIK